MHLYGTKLNRYLSGDLDAGARSAIDSHVGNCLPCAEALAARGLSSGRWERRGWLGRLVFVDASDEGRVA
jgi:hypothetical protein